VKMPLFLVCLMATLSATSRAAPPGGGFHGGSLHSGFAAHSVGTAFRMQSGMGRNFAFRRNFPFHQNHRFFDRGHRFFFQQPFWPVYWYPYDYSYLDYGPDSDYQYWDDSAAPEQPESLRRTVDNRPVVVVINTGSSPSTDSSSNAGHVDRAYSVTGAGGQQRIGVQEPNEKIGLQSDPKTFVAPQSTQLAAKTSQPAPRTQVGAFSNLVLVSWFEDAGKDEIYVQNIETKAVQKITSEPNRDNFRIVEVHRNADPQLLEVVISNGSEQGPVRFAF
jgi:hypothetical protein